MSGTGAAIEREFWRSIGSTATPALYGADQVGTLFDNEPLGGWNVNSLNSILNAGLPPNLNGITSSMLYFGTARSCFAWHTEDMELFSVNYLHCGAPTEAPEICGTIVWRLIPYHKYLEQSPTLANAARSAQSWETKHACLK